MRGKCVEEKNSLKIPRGDYKRGVKKKTSDQDYLSSAKMTMIF